LYTIIHFKRAVSVIPKTVNKDRMEQNFSIFDFELSTEDMNAIIALDKAETLFFSHYDPEQVERLTSMQRKF